MSSPDSKSKLKISDFGISKIWSSIEELRSRVGMYNGARAKN